jgi:hypothetical protein
MGKITMAPNPLRTAARDRRLAAIHEAGHVTVARWRGVNASAYLFPTETSDPFEKAWVGQARIGVKPKTTAQTVRLIAAAGTVAEECWHYRNAPGEFEDPWFWEEHFQDPNVMSATDWQMARTEPGDPDAKFMRAVETVHAAFTRELWPDVLRTARELIINSRRY